MLNQARPRLSAQEADQAKGAHLLDRMDLRPRRDGGAERNAEGGVIVVSGRSAVRLTDVTERPTYDAIRP